MATKLKVVVSFHSTTAPFGGDYHPLKDGGIVEVDEINPHVQTLINMGYLSKDLDAKSDKVTVQESASQQAEKVATVDTPPAEEKKKGSTKTETPAPEAPAVDPEAPATTDPEAPATTDPEAPATTDPETPAE